MHVTFLVVMYSYVCDQGRILALMAIFEFLEQTFTRTGIQLDTQHLQALITKWEFYGEKFLLRLMYIAVEFIAHVHTEV